MVYGMQLKPKGDKFIELAHAALAGITVAVMPWAFYVDMIPWCEFPPRLNRPTLLTSLCS